MGNKDIFDEEDINHIQAEYDSLVKNLLRCNKPGDREMIDKAFKIANEAHWNMRRKSGEPYILHPIAVAKIVNQEYRPWGQVNHYRIASRCSRRY